MAGEILENPLAQVYADWTPHASPDTDASPEESALITHLNALSPLDVRREEMRRFGRALDLIRQGNAKGAYDPRVEIGPETLYPEYASFKRVAKFATRAATVYAADGRTDRAVDLLLDVLVFADNTSRSVLIANLVGSASLSIAFAAFDDLLPRLSRTDAVKIERGVETLLARPTAARAVLPAETRMTVAGLRLAFEQSGRTDELFSDDEGRLNPSRKRMADEFAAMSRSEREAMFRRIVEQIGGRDALIDRTLAGPERDWIDGAKEIEASRADEPATLDDAMMAWLVPDYMGFVTVALRTRAQLRLLALHARLLQYRWDYGRFPERSNVSDPLTGKPFVYERRPDGTIRLASKGIPETGEIELRYRRVASEGNGSEP